MFRNTISVLALSALVACQSTTSDYTSAASRSEDAFGLTVMAQMMIAAGAAPLAFFPLLVAADLHATNAAMIDARSEATISDTYRYVYKRDLNEVGSSGSTGRMFRDLKSATKHFHKFLQGHRVANAQDFVLTAVRTADTQGYTLYALVHRPHRSIRVRDSNGRLRVLTPQDKDYYRPYKTDANGHLVDVVVDWTGVPRSQISTQKGQALLLTLAANSVMKNRRSDEFWTVERRWLSGHYRQVVAERQAALQARLQAS